MMHQHHKHNTHLWLLVLLLLCFFVTTSLCVMNPYEVLGVSKGASKEEIKRAYKTLALKWHPDKSTDENTEEAHKKYVEITNAYDILTDDEKLREYEMSQTFGRQTRSQAGGWHSFFRSVQPIFSETVWLTYENYDWFVTYDDVWIIQFYSDRCVACAEHAVEWELTAKSFKHFAKFGRVNTDEEGALTRNFGIRNIPTIVAWKHRSDIQYYRGPLDHNPLTEFVNSVLPHNVFIINSLRDFNNFLKKDEKSKVRVLLFSTHKREAISSLYKHISVKYADFLNFAQSNFNDDELMKKYDITNRPSLVIFRETSEQPIIYSQQTFNKETLESIIEDHKFLVVPEITASNYHNICGRKSKYNLCGIIVNINNDALFQGKIEAIRKIVKEIEGKENIPKVKFGHINNDYDTFINFFNVTPADSSILFLDIKRRRHLVYKDSINLENIESFLRSFNSKKFIETPHHVPLLIKYTPASSIFDYFSLFLSIPLQIFQFLINNTFITALVIFTLFRLWLT